MISVTKSDGLWQVVINRPEKANSLTRAMLLDMLQIVVAAKDTAQALVITGKGSVFSAGADLSEVQTGLATDPVWEQLSEAIQNLPCLTVAALNGTLAGGAFGMAVACDIRIAVERAEFFYPVINLGFLPQPSDPMRLAKLIGPARAKMLLLTGKKIDAATALKWGLIEQVIQPDQMEPVISELIGGALAAEPDHLSAIKNLF